MGRFTTSTRACLFLSAMVLLFSGCTAATGTPASVTDASEASSVSTAVPMKITAQEARKMIDAGGVVILDVRTQEEYSEGHIQDAVLLPDSEVASRAAEVLPDKEAPILVYCRSGRRSALASQSLVELGYTRIYDFGGIQDWPYETVR